VDSGLVLAEDTDHSLRQILQVAEEASTLTQQIESAMQTLNHKSEGVVIAVEAVNAVVEENSVSAEEMAANTQEVAMAMVGVSKLAAENSASADQVSASAEEMSAQIEEVTASAEELAALADALRAATAQFDLGRQNGASPHWVEPPLAPQTQLDLSPLKEKVISKN